MSSSMPGAYPEVIEACGKLGFDGVELDVGEDYQANLLWRAEGRKEVKQLLSGAGVELASICLGTFWSYSFASAEEAVRKRARHFTADAINWCAELGAKVILVPVTPGEREPGGGEGKLGGGAAEAGPAGGGQAGVPGGGERRTRSRADGRCAA
jgi:sugar phosphate isomerase/epimerase